MTYKEYTEKRTQLVQEAQTMIDSGNLEEAEAKSAEVDQLDAQWDATAEAQQKLDILSKNRPALNIQNMEGVQLKDTTVTATMNLAPKDTDRTGKSLYASDEYKVAWTKMMMGKPLSEEESQTVQLVNEYTHTTENTGVVIPTTVAAGIWDYIEELYPLWDDVQKTYIKGNYKAVIGDESSEAAWYDEPTATEDGKETFRELVLNGCELSRAITISWKLREMAMEDFIPYIQRMMARKMGAALGYGVSHGKGTPGTSDSFKAEPLGIVTALEKETGTPQVTTYTTGKLTYANLTAARAKVKTGANELKIYANSATIWNELANVVDGNGNPMFIPDPVNNGVYRVLGMEVEEDDSMSDGEILMSSPFVGYIANVNKDMSVMTEEHVKARTVDYCGYAIVDGGVTVTTAHSLLKYSGE